MLNNREAAIIFWLLVLLVFCLKDKNFRNAFKNQSSPRTAVNSDPVTYSPPRPRVEPCLLVVSLRPFPFVPVPPSLSRMSKAHLHKNMNSLLYCIVFGLILVCTLLLQRSIQPFSVPRSTRNDSFFELPNHSNSDLVFPPAEFLLINPIYVHNVFLC